MMAAVLEDQAIFPKQLSWHPSFALLSKSSPEIDSATILFVDISDVAALSFS